jgi:hypothetical protein
VLLDETINRLMVAYTAAHGNMANIVYRETALDSIAFSERRTLLTGLLNNVTSTKQSLTGQAVLMASNFPSTGISAAYSVLIDYGVGIPGDYNSDGRVDAADYLVWRKHAGTNTRLQNDWIGGTIGPAQYDQWRANYGAAQASGAKLPTIVVPEPCAMMHVTLWAAVAGLMYHPRSAGDRPSVYSRDIVRCRFILFQDSTGSSSR